MLHCFMKHFTLVFDGVIFVYVDGFFDVSFPGCVSVDPTR